MNKLDLDISNYSINDLKSFLNINVFDYGNLQQCVTSKIKQIMSIDSYTEKEKNKIVTFVNHINLRLIEQINGVNDLVKSNLEIKTPETNYEFPTYKKERANQYERKKLITHLSIDTKFRKNYLFTKSTDFYIDLPISLKNIFSMRMESFEINNTIYNISRKSKTNKIYVKKNNNRWLYNREYHRYTGRKLYTRKFG